MKQVPRSMAVEDSPNKAVLAAVAEIARSCGRGARRLLLSEHSPLAPKDIMMLSRTSPEYQQHVLDRIRAGHKSPLKKSAACALVYETVSFREVVSRLERALGSVRREAAFLDAKLNADVPKLDRGSDRLLTLAMVVETAEDIAAGIRGLPTRVAASTPTRPARKADQGRMPVPSGKLHAARALGLLSKNARNVPLLKPEHHPTGTERRQALNLCKQIMGLALPALREARRKWGYLDGQLRVRPRGKVTRRIVAHADPDGDALVAAWLAERYLFAGEAVEILFVPRGRVLGCLRIGDSLVDVGNTFDPEQCLYDHKPPALPSRHDSCAAKLVWDQLLADGQQVEHLEDLVLAVYAWDSVKHRNKFVRQATASKEKGFHAALEAAKRRGLNNAALYRHLRAWLDRAHPFSPETWL